MQATINLLKNFSILYVESDFSTHTNILKIYNNIFKKVYFADTTEKAFNLFEKHNTDIQLSIIEENMPITSGLQLINTIRNKYGYKHAILLTTKANNENIFIQGIKLGVLDYIIKPVLPKTHLNILKNILKPIHESLSIHVKNQELRIYKKSSDMQLLISKTDLDGTITYANEIFCKVSMFTKEELLGHSHNIVRHPNTNSQVFKELWDTIKRGETWSGTIQNKAKDGSSYYVEAKIFPLKNTKGDIVEYISLRQDITKYTNKNNLAKQVLRKTKLNYSKIYEDSITKANKNVTKELLNLKLTINRERENSKKIESKKNNAQKKLNETVLLKNQEIDKWKSVCEKSYHRLEVIYNENKKLTSNSNSFSSSITQKDNICSSLQNEIVQLQNEKQNLKKIKDNKDILIQRLEKLLT